MLAPESTTNSLSSGFILDAAGTIHSSEGEKNVTFSFSLSLKILLASFHGRIALVFRSLPEVSLQISRRRDCADEETWLVFCSAMDRCFLGCLFGAAQLLWIVLVEMVPKHLGPSLKSLQILAARRPAIHNPTVLHLSLLLHFCHRPSSAFCLFLNLPVQKWALCAEFTPRFRLIELTFGRMPTIRR